MKIYSLGDRERFNILHKWHKWFAWYPVRVNGNELRWLETIYRRLMQTSGYDPIPAFYWEYGVEIPKPKPEPEIVYNEDMYVRRVKEER